MFDYYYSCMYENISYDNIELMFFFFLTETDVISTYI